MLIKLTNCQPLALALALSGALVLSACEPADSGGGLLVHPSHRTANGFQGARRRLRR